MGKDEDKPITGQASIQLDDVTLSAAGRVDSPLPADHPMLSQIGRVAAEWALYEHTLDIVIWDLLGIDKDKASCLTGQIVGYRPRFNAIVALIESHALDPQLVTDFNRLSNDSVAPAEDRARIVHDAWYEAADGSVSRFRSYTRKGGKYGLHGISDADVQALLSRIESLTNRARALRIVARDARTASRGRSR